jgi:hypothetical protein
MSNVIKIILLVVLILIIICIAYFCILLFILFKSNNTPITNNNIINFSSETLVRNNRQYLIVSGEVFTSYPINVSVKQKRENDVVLLNVYTFLSKNSDVTFMHVVKLDKSINRVLFGPDKKIIWER